MRAAFSALSCTLIIGTPDPVKLSPGDSQGFFDNIPAAGLSGARLWAKYGCDDDGFNCEVSKFI
jgi:hypothetical protein